MMKLNVAGLAERSRVNGPGLRAVLWVRGCPIHCNGCFNRDLWDSEPAELVSVESLAARLAGISDIDGVTFSGGEPFVQAAALARLGGLLRDRGLSVVTFSGYRYPEILASADPDWKRLLEVTDLLIAGPYSGGTKPCKELVFLTDRLQPGLLDSNDYQDVEITITAKGVMIVTGYPDDRLLREL